MKSLRLVRSGSTLFVEAAGVDWQSSHESTTTWQRVGAVAAPQNLSAVRALWRATQSDPRYFFRCSNCSVRDLAGNSTFDDLCFSCAEARGVVF